MACLDSPSHSRPVSAVRQAVLRGNWVRGNWGDRQSSEAGRLRGTNVRPTCRVSADGDMPSQRGRRVSADRGHARRDFAHTTSTRAHAPSRMLPHACSLTPAPRPRSRPRPLANLWRHVCWRGMQQGIRPWSVTSGSSRGWAPTAPRQSAPTRPASSKRLQGNGCVCTSTRRLCRHAFLPNT